MDYSSPSPWQVEPPNYPKVPYYAVATFLPLSMGPLLLVSLLPKLLYQRCIQSVARHYSITKGDGKHSCIHVSLNCKGYSATQSLVEEYQGLYFGITKSRICTLYTKKLRYFRDSWRLGRYDFLNWEVAKVKFSMEEVYQDFWFTLIEFYKLFQVKMLNQQNTQLTSQEWVGFYKSTKDALPEWVVSVGYLKAFSPDPIQFSVEFMSTFPKSIMGLQFFILIEIKPNIENATSPTASDG